MSSPSSSPSPERLGRPPSDPDRDTRSLLLNAAAELFSEHGVAATSFSMIARRARFTPAMVHYHFHDRDQLIDAVVDERLVPLISYVWDPVKTGDPPPQIIRGLVQRLLERIDKAPWVPSTWMREILNEGGLLRGRMLNRLPIDKVRIVAEAIAQGQASEQLNSDLNPLLVVFSTLGLVMMHMATIKVWAEIFQRPPLTPEAIHRHITGLLLHGLEPMPVSPSNSTSNQPPHRSKP